MKNIVILTGAGISAESGIKTFRDSNGLWKNYCIEDVASLSGYRKNPNLVNQFYNERRTQILNAQPNDAHHTIFELEQDYQVEIYTQNIDDFHERAGSKNVYHMHGNILNAISSHESSDIKYPVNQEGISKKDEDSLRPDVVWFGEPVRYYQSAKEAIKNADIFIVIGTSFNVFPVANLIEFAPQESYNINPDETCNIEGFTNINENAVLGLEILLLDYF